MYTELEKPLASLFEGIDNFVVNASGFVATIAPYMENINWFGFYFVAGDVLLVGPYSGKAACVKIAKGKGVCGTAIEQRRALIVDDVHAFSGHIVCDPASKSELVIPIIENGTAYGVLDIDSPACSRFSKEDLAGLERLLNVLVKHSDLKKLHAYFNS